MTVSTPPTPLSYAGNGSREFTKVFFCGTHMSGASFFSVIEKTYVYMFTKNRYMRTITARQFVKRYSSKTSCAI